MGIKKQCLKTRPVCRVSFRLLKNDPGADRYVYSSSGNCENSIVAL